jgi:hypothetical protein
MPARIERGRVARASGREGRDWLVLPSAAAPTLLAPSRGPAGAGALSQFNDSMSQRARLAKVCLGIGIRSGLARAFARDHLFVDTEVADVGRDLIEGELPKLLGVPRVEVAISLGQRLRPNTKPVLQVLAPDGRVLAFAKLAWNDLTAELVRNEAHTLSRLEGRAIRSFRVPRVLHHGRWNGFDLVLLTPLPHSVVRRRPVNALPSSAVIREIGELGPTVRGPLIGGPYWEEVRRRALAVARYRNGGQLELTIEGLAQRISAVEVTHAMSHGDFTPWNMLHVRGSIGIWDWERASPIRPLGVDVLHFCFETAYQKERLQTAAALGVALERSGGTLGELGVSHGEAEAIRDVYALDRLTRLLEGRREAVPVDDRLADALAEFLDVRSGEAASR